MKQAKGNLISSQSCSCTSCLYRSGSERLSLRRFVAQGSRIDKLYYGNYLPLRERKLLEKLVRTRGVYDDVRNQLLSGSSSSISKPDLRPKKTVELTGKERDASKRSDIPALVRLVDKGEVSPSDISSGCCSCCSCSSKISLHDEIPGMHKHIRGHTGQQMTSKSSVISRHKKGNEYEVRKNVRFRTKRIRSDPCTCTLKLSKMNKRQTKAALKIIDPEKPEPVLERRVTVEEQQRHKRMTAKRFKRSLNQRIERSKNRLLESMGEGARKSVTKLKESKTKLKGNLESVAKKSIEKIQRIKRTNKEKIEAKQTGDVNSEESADVKSFKIIKDSLTKFKEKLRKKQEFNNKVCELDCFTKECVPEECFEEIKKRKLRKIKGKGYIDSSPPYREYEKRVGDMPNKSDVRIQVQETGKSIGTEKQTPVIRKTDANKRSLAGRNNNLEMKQKASKERGSALEKNKSITMSTTVCECPVKRRTKSVKSLKSIPRTVSKHSIQTTSVSSKNIAEKKEIHKSKSATRHNHLQDENVPHRHVSIPKPKHSKGENLPHNPTSDTKVNRSKEEVYSNSSRQAVRIGSNFSFNVEFYKEKPTTKSSDVKSTKEPTTPVHHKKYKVKKKDEHNEVRKHSRKQRSTITDPRRKSSANNTQSVGHPLKRCFCTLKLKTKKTTSVSESIQTTKMRSPPLLLPYECEPLVCVPGKCDTKECEKRIRKRNTHYHSVPTNVKPRLKSTSSNTPKSSSSVTSKNIQAYSIKKPVKYKTSTVPPVSRLTENKSNKKAVRIGSTFSFDIEFSKENPTFAHNEKNKMDTAYALKQKKSNGYNNKRNKSVDKAKRYIVHKYSQISSSGVKSRYTVTKNSLRRCFCTTKLGKHGKRKTKPNVTSKSTLTTQESVSVVPKKPILKTISVSTEKKAQIREPVQRRLLPYECEPGVCVPGYCNPNNCKELLIKRKSKRLKGHTRKLNTGHTKTKSTSSLTTRSVSSAKTKKVQSASETYKSNVHKQHSKKNSLVQKQKSMFNDSPKRQAVRIGSTFSFNVDFFKEGMRVHDPILSVRQSPKSVQHRNKLTLRDRNSQVATKSKEKAELVHVKKKYKNISIGPAMKRCFCTLKLQKTGKNKKKLSTGTNTVNYKEKMPQKNKTRSIGTKTNENFKFRSQLEQYECEPNICIPDECDPYRCLDIIKRRDNRGLSYEKGVTTKLSKMRSASSSTQKIGHKSKNQYIQYNNRTQRKSHKNPRQTEPTPSFKFSSGSADINNIRNQSYQSVNVGSKFSFDIEFYKDRSYERKANAIDKGPKERGDVKIIKALKNKGHTAMKISSIQHKSQGVEIKKNHQATGIGPTFKRCFCTLNFPKKGIGANKLSRPLSRTIKQPRVYTVRRMSVEKTNILCKPLFTRDLKNSFECEKEVSIETNTIFNSNSRIIYGSFSNVSMTKVQFKSKEMRSYFCKSNYYPPRAKTQDLDKTFQNIVSRHSTRITSRIEIKLPRSRSTQTISLTGRGNKVLENQVMEYIREPDVTELNRRITEITGVKPYLSRCFCTMNIHIDNQEKLNEKKLASRSGARYSLKKSKNRLEPYECEPGICVTGQCDPIACKELILKRLMKTVSKMSNTEEHLKSSSSDTHGSASMSKAKKLQSNISLSPRTKSEKRKLSRVRYEKSKYLPSHKQAVRIGSNFSFNIDFSKDSKNVGDFEKYKLPSRRKKYKSINTTEHRSNKGTKGIGVDNYDKQSQSESKRMESKASTITPFLNRCFCTLKLQKIGIDLTIASKKANTKWKPMSRNDTVKIKTAESSQNTEPLKHYKTINNLSPYECEPQICVPGKCNPQQCLEIIKRRKLTNQAKEFALESMKSTSSIKEKQNHPQPTERYHLNKVEKMKPSPQLDQAQWKTALTAQTEASHTHPKKRQSFFKQCVCSLKCLVASKGTKSKILNLEIEKPAKTDNAGNEKVKTYNNTNLEPYECEPNVCTPGECDPYECEKRIRKRNFKRECGTSTKQLITKSTSNMTKEGRKLKYLNVNPIDNQEKYTSRGKTKNIRKLTKSITTSEEPTKLRRNKRHKMMSLGATVDNPNRQAVRIGSSFSFDIEFSKNKSYGKMKKISESPNTKTKDIKSVCSYTRQSSISSKHKKTQQLRTLRHRDTQFFAQRVRSTMTHAAPFLQRCFCTLKLHKPNNILTTASKKTIANFPVDKHSNNIQSPVKTDEKSTRTSKKMHTDRWNLEPFECEPGVCIPGKCNPYECEKKIKARENRKHSKLSNTDKSKEMTRFVSTCTESKAKKSQAKSYAYEKRHKRRNNVTEALAAKPSGNRFTESPNRQTVHIGSNFSFDVQFYKDKSIRNSTNSCDSRNNSNLKDKTMNDTGSSTKMDYNNKSTGHEAMGFSHGQSQAQGPKMESKGSGVGLLLKRCFCTLKLQKYGKTQQLLQKSEKQSKNKTNYLTYNAATTANNKSRITSLVKSISRRQQIVTTCDPHICNLEHVKKSGYTSVENQNKTNVHIRTCPCDAESTNILISTKNKKSKRRPGLCACVVNFVAKGNKVTTDKKTKKKSHLGNCTYDMGVAEPQDPSGNSTINKKNKSKGRPGKCTCDAGDAEPTSGLQNASPKKKSKSTGRCKCDAGDAEPINQPVNNSTVKINKRKLYPEKCEYNSCKGKTVNEFENLSARQTKKSKGYVGKCICDPCGTETVNKIDNVSVTNANKDKIFSDKCLCDSSTRKGKRFSGKSNKSRDYSRKSYKPNNCSPGVSDQYECYGRLQRQPMGELGTDTVFPTNKSKFTLKDADYKSRHARNWNEKGYESNLNTRKQPYKEESLDTYSSEDSHRQIVRIGSSFSFDLEFYKNRLLMDSGKKNMSNRINLPYSKKHIQTPNPQNLKNRASEGKSSLYSRKTQVETVVNKQSKASGIGPILKRCFCTLKLQKSRQPMDMRQLTIVPKTVKDKPKPSVVIKNRGTSTKIKHLSRNLEPYQCEPGTCTPGECNPYKCEERIQTCISRKIGTHDRFSYATVSTMTGKSVFSKAKRMQSDIPQRETMVIEQPRFPFLSHLKNKQAVRIGSNFSVNIEFYKEVLAPKQFVDSKDYGEIGNSKKSMSNSTKTKSFYPKYSGMNEVVSNTLQTGVIAENEASFASKVLRRCFCKPCVPQLSKDISVGRAEEHRIKTSINPQQYCVCYQVQKSQLATKKCVCITDAPFCKATKTASTKIDKKYLKCKSACQNKQFTKSKTRYGNDSNNQKTCDMETILPYTPEKFNKKASKSCVLHNNMNNDDRNAKKKLSHGKYNNQIYQKPDVDNKIYKKRSPKLSESAKSLTAKKGKKSIIEAKDMKICSVFNIKSAICRCKQMFSKSKSKLNDTTKPPNKQSVSLSKKPNRLCGISQTDVLKQSKSERRPKNTRKTKPKKSKSLKIAQASERTKCQCCFCEQGGKKYSKFQSGDAVQGQTTRDIVNVHKSGNMPDQISKFNCPLCRMLHHNNPDGKNEQPNKKVVQFFVNPANSYVNEVRKNHPTLIEFMANYICTSNKNHSKSIQSSKPQDVKVSNKTEKRSNKRDAGKGDAASTTFSTKKVNQRFSNNKKANTDSCPHCNLKQNRKTNEQQKNYTGQPDVSNLNKFGQLECGAKLKITPKGSKPIEKESKRSKMDKKEGKLGVSKKNLIKQCACQTMPKKGMICECVNETKSRNIARSILNLIKPQKICGCHSSQCECAKVYKITQRTKNKMKKILKLRERNLKRKIKREKYAKKHAKNKKNTEKKKRKAYNARQNQYKKEDALRRKKRIASDKYLEKRLKSIKNTRDLLLAADSLYDIAKLGCTVVCDVARSSCRAIQDPSHTYQRVKKTAKQPKRICPIIKTAIRNSGAIATFKRIIRRCKGMGTVKSLKKKLQKYEFTNYLMNMTNKDPRKRTKRLKKKKGKVRKREPMDFKCSLYMATLRKRPCLAVYYLCPWFYPHFVTMMQALKQFTDILLFLLAVVVWSPCILCMELCRAMMCCFLCTG